ncbi:MAG TPA: fibronectin type III domain-containing protein, partial [Iamia sp.]|nr:fibronectin type III domain-containing protein [Iamia sp.]
MATVVVAGTIAGVMPVAPLAPAGAVVNPTPTIDPLNRASVWAAYQSSLVEAQAVPVGWSGTTSPCVEGSESAASIAATRAALNFYRGLNGLPNATIDAGASVDAMRAALLMEANSGEIVNHNPPSSWTCWTQPRDDAAFNHNLSSFSGARAIEQYVIDNGDSNDWAGHRRSVLSARATSYAVGSTTNRNAMRVTATGDLPAGVDWIAWPNEGFVPKATIRPYLFWQKALFSLWNVEETDLDFSAATVSVKVGSTSLPVEIRDENFNQLTWYTTLPADWDTSAADVKFDITVSGIKTAGGAAVANRIYSSTAITSASAATAPGAPTGVTATAGNAQANVSWTAPASTGGSPITGYKVTPYIGGTAQTPQTTSGAGTTKTVTGLTNGTAYTFKVQAVNAIGTGPLSSASAAVTPATTPGAPTGVSAIAGNHEATVSWTAPAATGGSAITGYRVTPYVGATAQTAQSFSGAGTSRIVTGLTNGVAYTFKVQAVNAKGTGALSAASAAVTPATVAPPYAPYSSWSHLVDQVYRQLIGRLPTANERSQWVNTLQTGTSSPGDLVANLRQSSHHKNVVDQVTRLYRAYYLRSPDKGGLEYWIAQRLGGRTMVSISDFFSRSAEFIEIYGPLSNAEFVALVYQNVLGRPGSVADRSYWTSEISSGRRTRGTVMIGFSESAEYKGTQSSEVTVSVLYILWL